MSVVVILGATVQCASHGCAQEAARDLSSAKPLIVRRVAKTTTECPTCVRVLFDNPVTGPALLVENDPDLELLPEEVTLGAVRFQSVARGREVVKASVTFDRDTRARVREYVDQDEERDAILVSVGDVPVAVLPRRELGSSILVGTFDDVDSIIALFGRPVSVTRVVGLTDDADFEDLIRDSDSLLRENQEILRATRQQNEIVGEH